MVELDSGEIYLNARTSNSSVAKRGIYLGRNRGLTWTEIGYDENMPPYQAVDSGLLAVRHNGEQVLLLSRCRQPMARRELTISASLAAGKTWALHMLVHEDGASYSDMVELADGTIGLLYRVQRVSGGTRGAQSDAAFIRFNLAWLGL